MSAAVDITDEVDADLCAIVLQSGARLYRLEASTLMLRHPDTLDSRFFLDEADALGQLRDGKPPARGKPQVAPWPS